MLELLIILLAKMTEVTLTTLRTVFISKGEKTLASSIGFVEVTIWLKVASVVLVNINDYPAKMFVYALGFAIGSYIGLTIEDKLGLGHSQIQIIVDEDEGENLANSIRNLGRAVTVVKGDGKNSNKLILLTYVKRKNKEKVLSEIKDTDIDVFVTVSETQKVYGGFGVK